MRLLANKYLITTQAVCDLGRVRSNNEDAIAIVTSKGKVDNLTDFDTNDNVGVLLLVADGMGGANAGEIASESVIRSLVSFFVSDAKNITSGQEEAILIKWFEYAHKHVRQLAMSKLEWGGMGSTLTAIWLRNEKAHIVWCGDSRCYLYRNQLRQLSEDHSLVNEYVKKGLISPESARKHPNKHVLTQVLGDDSNQIRPDSLSIDLVENDIFLICSDGLNNMLDDEKISLQIEKGGKISQNLLDQANEAGGNDNISIIIFDVKKKL